jgi:hypothetical protein
MGASHDTSGATATEDEVARAADALLHMPIIGQSAAQKSVEAQRQAILAEQTCLTKEEAALDAQKRELD